jgi:hypothetical protein
MSKLNRKLILAACFTADTVICGAGIVRTCAARFLTQKLPNIPQLLH